jgi:hypothetical protein
VMPWTHTLASSSNASELCSVGNGASHKRACWHRHTQGKASLRRVGVCLTGSARR